MNEKVGSTFGFTTSILRPYDLVDRPPVVHRRAAERVHAQLEAGGADGVHVDDIPQVLDVGQDEVLLVRGRRLDGRRERHALHAGIAAPQQFVGPVLDPLRDVRIGRAAVGRVVLEAAVLGGLCEGVMTMPSARCSLRPRL